MPDHPMPDDARSAPGGDGPPAGASNGRGTRERGQGAVTGLEDVVVLSTSISDLSTDGGRLLYRGVDVADLVGHVPFEQVWSLLVDGRRGQALPPAEPFPLPVRTGDVRVDVQSALAQVAPVWGFQPLLDIDAAQARDDLARASVLALSFIAQSARGPDLPMVPQGRVDRASTTAERFLVRWHGEADPRHVAALDAFWVATAEHGLNPSTFTARVVASTGADVAACLSAAVAAMSGPLGGGAPSRVVHALDGVEQYGDADRYVRTMLDRGVRLMGFGHRVYRGVDPRAALLKETCRRLGARRFDIAVALEEAGTAALAERWPGRSRTTNVEFWGAVLLDAAQVPPPMLTPLFVCARTAGWSAHVLEQHAEGRLLRPRARYVGPPHRPLGDVPG